MTSPPANDADLHGLAAAVAGTNWLDAPAEVRDQVVDLVADCVAVAALGSARVELRRLAEVHAALTPAGDASVLGSARGWPPMTAMLLNATRPGRRPAAGRAPARARTPRVPRRPRGARPRRAAGPTGRSCSPRSSPATRPAYASGAPWAARRPACTTSVPGGRSRSPPPPPACSPRATPTPRDGPSSSPASAVLLTDAHTVFAGHSGSHTFLGVVGAGRRRPQGMAAVAGLAAAPGAL